MARSRLPLEAPDSMICRDHCSFCARKLLLFAENEIERQETRLAAGDPISLGDVDQFARAMRKVEAALRKGGFLAHAQTDSSDV